MDTARRIARIAGPVLVVLAITEGANIDVFAGNPPPLVYLNGTVLLVAGVAILQAYRRWTADLSVLVTLTGWMAVAAGVYRMAFPRAEQLGEGPVTVGVLALLTLAGALLCLRGYGPERGGPR